MSTSSALVVDDQLLVGLLIGSPPDLPPFDHLATTSAWYYRACRAAVGGGSGQLSRPFLGLEPPRQARAIRSLFALPEDVGLSQPRDVVPAMAQLWLRHRTLNWLNLEAAALAKVLHARMALSPGGAQGVLPPVLDAEGIAWSVAA